MCYNLVNKVYERECNWQNWVKNVRGERNNFFTNYTHGGKY